MDTPITVTEQPTDQAPELPVAGFHGEDSTNLNLVLDVSPIGTYANGAVVWTNPSDLVIDFYVGPMSPSDEEVKIVARLRLPPPMASELADILGQKVEQARQRYGGQT